MAKTKIDSKAIQAWLTQHAEKIALGFGFGILLWMGYTSWSVKGYQKKPEELSADVQNAHSRVKEAHKSWDMKGDGVTLPNPPYAIQVAEALKPLDAKPYEWPILFNVPLYEKKLRRGEPKYLPPIELRAAFTQGAIQLHEKEGYSGFYWTVLTAAIPAKQQQTEYNKQFKNAVVPFDPERDRPKYIDYAVERAEVTQGDSDPKWETLDLDRVFDVVKTFNAQRSEIIENELLETFNHDPPIMNKIPSLIEPAPDISYAHEPQIGLSAKGPVREKEVKAPEAGVRRPGAGGVQPPKAAEPKKEEKAKVDIDFKLFRLCDFTVRRGAKYIYRVKVVLENPNGPNSKIQAHECESPEFVNGATRETVWSTPSEPVFIPGDFKMAAVEAVPPVSVNDAMAKFMMLRFHERAGVEVGHAVGKFIGPQQERGYERGTRIQFLGQNVKVRKPGAAVLGEGQADFPFDGLLAGISGGEQGKKQQRGPAELLCVWPDGRLSMHNQVSDSLSTYLIDNPAPPVAAAGAVAAPPAGGAAPPPAKTPDKPKSFADLIKTPTTEKKDKK